MTSPPYFASFFVLFCFVYFENKISHFVIACYRPWQIGFQIELENSMKCLEHQSCFLTTVHLKALTF